MSMHQYKNVYANGYVINPCLTELKRCCNQNNLDSTTRISSHGRILHNTRHVTVLSILGNQKLTSPWTRRFQMRKKRRIIVQVIVPSCCKAARKEVGTTATIILCTLLAYGGKWRTLQVTRVDWENRGTVQRVLNLTCESVLVSPCQETRKKKQ